MSSEASSSPRSSPEPAKKSSSKKRKNELNEIEVDLNLPEPPSKKAKRALKKGKPLPPKKGSDDEGEGTAKDGNNDTADGDKPAAKKERSPFGVWIGNLRFTVTKDDLRRWLIDNSGGSITDEMITRVHLPSSKLKGKRAAAIATPAGEGQEFENKGFAYVDFTTFDATVAAIALSETEWHRRKLLIKDAKSYEGRPEEHLKKNKAAADKEDEDAAATPQSTSRKIFVGNMSFQTTEEDVRELFSKCGEIEWAKVATFEDSGKCKGYGWVKFKEAISADWAVKGFVKIKEVEETEEDFMDVDNEEAEEESDKEEDEEEKKKDDEDSEDSEEEDEDESKNKKKVTKKQKPVQEKKIKMRKWWVNTLNGRRLKVEHAEDDQTRYKKRFGKKEPQQQYQQRTAKQSQYPTKHNNNPRRRRDGDEGGNDQAENRAPAEVNNFRSDINVARLTGAAVKPEGKKIMFD